MTAARIIHNLAGSPAFDGAEPHDGRCWLCAQAMARGVPTQRWMGANFTDQNKARWPAATHVCEPCAWACSWTPPPGWAPDAAKIEKKRDAKRKAGKAIDPSKERPESLRLFSHLYDGRGYLFANKASKALIREWLRAPKRPPWFAAIADSGQKHILPWTPVNPDPRRGAVRFEETLVQMPHTDTWGLVDDATALLTAGVPKAEIESGEYSPRRMQKHARAIRAFESRWAHLRGSGWWSLAMWLSQKEDEGGQTLREAARRAAGQDGEPVAGDAGGVPGERRQRAQALGPDPRPDARGGENDDDRGGMDERNAPGPAAQRTEQLDLFAGGGAE